MRTRHPDNSGDWESRETVAGARQHRSCSGSGDSGQFSLQDSSEMSNSEAISS